MARIGLYGEIGLDTSKLQAGIRKSLNVLDSFGNKAVKVAGFTTLTAGVGALTGGFFALKKAVESASSFEQLEISMTKLVGSGEEAKKVLQDIEDFSIKTPFETQPLQEYTKNLISAGVEIENVGHVIRRIGAVSKNTQQVGELSDAFTKGFSKGVFQTEDINKFTERGINLNDALKDLLGLQSKLDLKKEFAKGIDPKIMIKALEIVEKKISALEEQSTSFNGLLSTLSGAFNQAFIKLGDPIAKSLKPALDQAIKLLNSSVPKIQDFGKYLGDIISEKLNTFISNLPKLLDTLKGAFNKILPIIKSFGNFLSNTADFISKNTDLVLGFAKALGTAFVGLKVLNGVKLASGLATSFLPLGKTAGKNFAGALSKYLGVFGWASIGIAIGSQIGKALSKRIINEIDVVAKKKGYSDKVFFHDINVRVNNAENIKDVSKLFKEFDETIKNSQKQVEKYKKEGEDPDKIRDLEKQVVIARSLLREHKIGVEELLKQNIERKKGLELEKRQKESLDKAKKSREEALSFIKKTQQSENKSFDNILNLSSQIEEIGKTNEPVFQQLIKNFNKTLNDITNDLSAIGIEIPLDLSIKNTSNHVKDVILEQVREIEARRKDLERAVQEQGFATDDQKSQLERISYLEKQLEKTNELAKVEDKIGQIRLANAEKENQARGETREIENEIALLKLKVNGDTQGLKAKQEEFQLQKSIERISGTLGKDVTDEKAKEIALLEQERNQQKSSLEEQLKKQKEIKSFQENRVKFAQELKKLQAEKTGDEATLNKIKELELTKEIAENLGIGEKQALVLARERIALEKQTTSEVVGRTRGLLKNATAIKKALPKKGLQISGLSTGKLDSSSGLGLQLTQATSNLKNASSSLLSTKKDQSKGFGKLSRAVALDKNEKTKLDLGKLDLKGIFVEMAVGIKEIAENTKKFMAVEILTA